MCVRSPPSPEVEIKLPSDWTSMLVSPLMGALTCV